MTPHTSARAELNAAHTAIYESQRERHRSMAVAQALVTCSENQRRAADALERIAQSLETSKPPNPRPDLGLYLIGAIVFAGVVALLVAGFLNDIS